MSKFAPITAQLLARKGEAMPSLVPHFSSIAIRVVEGPRDAAQIAFESHETEAMPEMLETIAAHEAKFVYSPVRPPRQKHDADGPHEKPRRIVLNLTPQEYETLGLVAVKKGVTRHELAQSAIDAYFDWLVEEFGESCGCITGGATERCCKAR